MTKSVYEPEYIDGLNGKRYRVPQFILPDKDDEFKQAMSVLAYGRPPLNEDEQTVYDVVLPILTREGERQEEEHEQMMDSLGVDDLGHWFVNSGRNDMDAEALAYEIAEKVVAEGYRLVKHQPNPNGGQS